LRIVAKARFDAAMSDLPSALFSAVANGGVSRR
jgi:hypothetical protein